MQNFWHRFKFYFFGLLLGSVIAYYTLVKGKNRNLDAWLPDGRVILKISKSTIIINDSIQCQADCLQIGDSTTIRLALEGADVLFDESEQKGTPKVFVISTKDAKKLTIELTDDKAKLMKVESMKKVDCDC